MSKESVQISLAALPLIVTLLFMYLAEQKIKTVGELISFLVSKTQFFINFISNTSLIFIALIVTSLIFIGFLVFNRKK